MIKFYIFLRPNGGSFFGCYIMATFSNFKQPEKEQKFICKLCDFSCSKKANYTRHLDTEKHKLALSATLATDESSEKPQKEQKSAKLFRCDICDKAYKDKTGLWRHKKKCGVPAANLVCQNAQPVAETSSQISPELVLQVLEKNKELTEVVMEQNKTIMELSKNSQIQTQNAQRTDAMNQYATAEQNKIAAQNAQNELAVNEADSQREAAINQFNSQLEDQRQRFNVENQRVIDQSNVTWRRQINTANTSAVNAANQTNAENLLNLSNYALSALWQQWRDEASWVNTSSQNEDNRNHNLAMAALERSTAVDLQNKASKDAMYQMIGKFGFKLLAG